MEGSFRVSLDRIASVVVYAAAIDLGLGFYGALGPSGSEGVLFLLCETRSGARSGTECDGGHAEQEQVWHAGCPVAMHSIACVDFAPAASYVSRRKPCVQNRRTKHVTGAISIEKLLRS